MVNSTEKDTKSNQKKINEDTRPEKYNTQRKQERQVVKETENNPRQKSAMPS